MPWRHESGRGENPMVFIKMRWATRPEHFLLSTKEANTAEEFHEWGQKELIVHPYEPLNTETMWRHDQPTASCSLHHHSCCSNYGHTMWQAVGMARHQACLASATFSNTNNHPQAFFPFELERLTKSLLNITSFSIKMASDCCDNDILLPDNRQTSRPRG